MCCVRYALCVLLTAQALGSLVDAKDGSDLQLMCAKNDQPLYAHRAILAMRCERFRALFGSGMGWPRVVVRACIVSESCMCAE